MTEERVQQLEERLAEETQRLEKLYVAYRRIEEELQEKNAIIDVLEKEAIDKEICLLYTSPSPRDQRGSRMPSSA